MASLNTSSNGPSITASYQKIVSAPPASGGATVSPTYGQWAVFTVQAPLVSAFQSQTSQESVLKVQTTGEGELIDMVEEFSDGRIQFAFLKVKDPNTTLPKNVLIAWCGEGVPERTKGYFTSHVNAVSRLFQGYHVQITARSDSDLAPERIVQKVADASGSKYSGGGAPAPESRPPPPIASKPTMPTKSFGAAGGFQPLGARSRAPQPSGPIDEDGWGQDAPQVTRSQIEKVQSAYQPTSVNMGQLQSEREPSRYQPPPPSARDPGVIGGGYQPVGKVDINALRSQAQDQSRLQDDRPTVVRGAYEPVGKVDIAEIRRKAQGAPAPAPVSPPSQAAPTDNDRPQSLADRSAAFTSGGSGGRLSELPKPQVSNRFGSQTSSFTGTRAPAPSGFDRPAAAAPSAATASKTFADEGGKTPAQIWAEKKARQRGDSGAAETQPPAGFVAPASPIQSQTSGGWQSGYGGKKWGVQIPTRTGGSSGVAEQRTGEEPVRQDEQDQEPATGGVGAIRNRFKNAAPMGAAFEPSGGAPEPPPLDTSSKPNAGARGVPIPGLPQKPRDEDHQDLPPPPPRPMPADEQEDEPEEDDYAPRGSPVLVAQPVGRGAEPAPIEKAEPLPDRALPTHTLQQEVSRHEEPEPESQVLDDDPARGAGQAAAESTFGVAGDPRSAGTSGGREAVAQYDYDKAEDNELQLTDGEKITNIDMVDDDWWMGQNSKGESGLFPANYVELLPETDSVGVAAPQPSFQESAPAPPPAPAAPAAAPAASQGSTATAQYDYEAAEDNEISFPDGAKITNVEFPDDDWWLGTYNGQTGLFPANYVELN